VSRATNDASEVFEAGQMGGNMVKASPVVAATQQGSASVPLSSSATEELVLRRRHGEGAGRCQRLVGCPGT
jgi:hypothetical protein